MTRLQAVVKRGRAAGAVLTPHVHADGSYVVSMTRFAKDYIRVGNASDLGRWIADGYSVRMSNQAVPSHRSPSLICPGSIGRSTPSPI